MESVQKKVLKWSVELSNDSRTGMSKRGEIAGNDYQRNEYRPNEFQPWVVWSKEYGQSQIVN